MCNFHNENKKLSFYIDTEKFIKINNNNYKVFISIYDNYSLQGNISYDTLCSNTDIILKYKNMINKEDKSRMLKVYKDCPETFTNYAQGDLMNYETLMEHEKLFIKLYDLLGISTYFKETRQTIGKTVFSLLEASLMKTFKIENTLN
uniref:Uncharacterized protein n=1 Tax=Cliftonaea pectinata TaxID=2007206 RepID=A0A1Z1MQF4_9FLOR|nr:hypothetical protein [Cliftonaea pectinata]ARW68099.1 hypothetical protein [Cliftonaea pectinata]